MISLRSHRPIIKLEGKSGIELGIDLLRHTYSSEHIRYFDLEVDFRPFSQVTFEDQTQMARAFLLYMVRAYLFANWGQPMSLRWLALFHNIEDAGEANWGYACLTYFYLVMDILSGGTLWQLVGPCKLLEFRFFLLSSLFVVVRTYMNHVRNICQFRVG